MGLEYRCDCCANVVGEGYLRLTYDEPTKEGFEDFDYHLCEECKKIFEPILKTFMSYREKKFVLVKA
jgi:predicted secreted protein